jgi:hypothetical protein
VKRTLTPLTKRFRRLARRASLPNALGRALALTARHYNDGYGNQGDKDAVASMRSFRPETARRWLRHWTTWGSLKALARSVDSERIRRKLVHVPTYIDKNLMQTARDLGFWQDHRAHGFVCYRKTYDDGLTIDIQLWVDGGHRVSHWHDGHMDTHPTYFRTAEGMVRAVEFERTRTERKVPKNHEEKFE